MLIRILNHLLFPRDKKEVFTFLNGDEKTTTFGEVFTRSGRLVRGPLIVRPPQLEQAVYLDYEDELGMSDFILFFSLRLTHEIHSILYSVRGSVTFWCRSGSGSVDPYLLLIDPTPFFSDFTLMIQKIYFFIFFSYM
jgi:hypothetical protein